MNKPEIIQDLEKKLQTSLFENKTLYNYYRQNGFKVNKDNVIVELKLTALRLDNIDFLLDFEKLEYLQIDYNYISDVDIINSLTQLKILHISNNNIQSIENLSLPNLERLYIGRNRLTNLNGIENLPKLKSLDFYGNKVENLQRIEHLKNLESLDMRYNAIQEITMLKSLDKLRKIYASGNKVSSIDVLEDLEDLRVIDFSANDIKAIPNLQKLVRLDYLNLAVNKIELGIENLNNLINLRYIYLSYNKLSLLPELNLPAMKKMYLYSNNISRIVKYNPQHRYYYHDDNRFNGVLLNENPLDSSLIELLKIQDNITKQTQLQDYFSNLELGAAPLLEAKLMILGEGESGKTNLRNYIIEGKFQQGKSATTGISIDTWKQTINEKDFRINIWDFGGQWIQQQVHQFFLTNESVYIVLLNARQDEKPEKWLDWIKNYTKDSKVFVVVNKMDENPNFSLQQNLLKNEYPFIVGFHYISLLNTNNCGGIEKQKVEKLLSEIKNQITELKNINALVPKNYHDLKNDLEDNYFSDAHSISFDRFKSNLFEKHKIIGDPENLLNLLEKIGTIRFFKNFDKLILSPEWLSDGVYKILMSEIASLKNGVIDENDIKKIIIQETDEKFSYREGDIPFIKKLMEDFKLAYIKDKNYFIPSQFMTDLPSQINLETIEKEFVFKFYFEFDTYFPEILISKFIVDFFEIVDGNNFWKTGILIKDEDTDLKEENFAFIISREKERRIFIHMNGKNIRGLFKGIQKNILSYLSKTDYKFKEFIIHKESGLPINYRELIILYQNGTLEKQLIDEKKATVFNINVKDTLGLINSDKELEILKKENEKLKNKTKVEITMGDKFIFEKNEFDGNNQIGAKNSIQNNYINNYAKNEDLNEAKMIIEEFQQIVSDNEEWKNVFMQGMNDLINLQNSVSIEEETEAKSGLRKFYDVAKEFVAVKNILALPVDVQEKGEQMLSFIKEIF